MSHAVLSSRCLRGRVRFEMLVEECNMYLQVGVCWVHDLPLDSAVVNTAHSWVCYSSQFFAHDHTYTAPSLPDLSLGTRIGFAVDVEDRSMAVYADGEHALSVYNLDTSHPLYACAFLGGLRTRVALVPPLRAYPFARPRAELPEGTVFGAVGPTHAEPQLQQLSHALFDMDGDNVNWWDENTGGWKQSSSSASSPAPELEDTATEDEGEDS